MTEAEWLTCEDANAMLRTGRGTRQERVLALDTAHRPEVVLPGDEELFRATVNLCRVRGIGLGTKDAELRQHYANIVRCVIPFRRIRFRKQKSETVLALARGIEADSAFDRMPILADALEELGADPLAVEHCRYGQHWSGCWTLEALRESVGFPRDTPQREERTLGQG
jgi:hypothetical protein